MSAWATAARCNKAGVSTTSGLRYSGRRSAIVLQEPAHPRPRRVHPRRLELGRVDELVAGFLELERAQQPAVDRTVRLEEGGPCGVDPALDVGAVAGPVLVLDGPAEVVERAEHRSDITKGRSGRGAVGNRPGGLALEVEHDEAVAGGEDLADVEVAVDALERRRLGRRLERRELGADASAPAAELLGDVGGHDVEHARELRVGRLVPGVEDVGPGGGL